MRTEPTMKTSIKILYVNHRGERSVRRVEPKEITYGTCKPWHDEPQWLLVAYCMERGANRTFALRDVLAWDVP